MNKAILISLNPEFCDEIIRREKTLEIRKSKPKIEPIFKCYIYCTKNFKIGTSYSYKTWASRGKIIGEFVCDKISAFRVLENGAVQDFNFENLNRSCLSYEKISEYIGRNMTGYSWQITDLVVYDMPKELSYFNLKRPPQSWCYVDYPEKEM